MDSPARGSGRVLRISVLREAVLKLIATSPTFGSHVRVSRALLGSLLDGLIRGRLLCTSVPNTQATVLQVATRANMAGDIEGRAEMKCYMW